MATSIAQIGKDLKDIGTKQENTVSIINQKLSPKQTIGVALIVGIVASVLGSALFLLWTQAGEIVAKTPVLVNSTIP